jgi:hypothetical protein
MILQFARRLARQKKMPATVTPVPEGPGVREVVNIATFQEPPFREGLPVVEASALLAVPPYSTLLESIEKFSGLRLDERSRFINPVIERMARYANLLPASQFHHHCNGGGALQHALEVALYTMRMSDEHYYRTDMLPSQRAPVQRRYQAIAFLAGLLHDIGKIISDFVVTDATGREWNPLTHDLYEWAESSKIDRIYLSWNFGRHKRHEARYKGALNRLIPQETREWITDQKLTGNIGREMWADLEDALDPNNSGSRIGQIVIKADMKSTSQWLTSNPVGGKEGLTVPVDRYLVELMREWIGNGVWRANLKGSRLWVMDGKLFINWAIAARDLTDDLYMKNIRGIPRDSNQLAKILVEKGIAESYVDIKGQERMYWPFLPDRLVKARKAKATRPEWGLMIREPVYLLPSATLPPDETGSYGLPLERKIAELLKKTGAGKKASEPAEPNEQPPHDFDNVPPNAVPDSEYVPDWSNDENDNGAPGEDPTNTPTTDNGQTENSRSGKSVAAEVATRTQSKAGAKSTRATPTQVKTNQKSKHDKKSIPPIPATWKQLLGWLEYAWRSPERDAVWFETENGICADYEELFRVIRDEAGTRGNVLEKIDLTTAIVGADIVADTSTSSTIFTMVPDADGVIRKGVLFKAHAIEWLEANCISEEITGNPGVEQTTSREDEKSQHILSPVDQDRDPNANPAATGLSQGNNAAKNAGPGGSEGTKPDATTPDGKTPASNSTSAGKGPFLASEVENQLIEEIKLHPAAKILPSGRIEIVASEVREILENYEIAPDEIGTIAFHAHELWMSRGNLMIALTRKG